MSEATSTEKNSSRPTPWEEFGDYVVGRFSAWFKKYCPRLHALCKQHLLKKQFFNLPNLLTLLRFVLTGPIVLLLLQNGQWFNVFALITYAISLTTDFLDGNIARKYKCDTKIGAFLDPLADKVLLLCIMVFKNIQVPFLWSWLVYSVVGFEILFMSLRGLKSLLKLNIKSNNIGKYKMVVEAIVVLCQFLEPDDSWRLAINGLLLIPLLLLLYNTIHVLIEIYKHLLVWLKSLKKKPIAK